MCGINGLFLNARDQRVQLEDIEAMRDSMVHRGPDDSGAFLDQNVGLGHRRLSIIGVSTGHQPMVNKEQTLWIVYNGETYNYSELRKMLAAKGYVFQTESDTEVVLNLYAEYGTDCVKHMNGLFAFAIWDQKARELFIARDRLGIKPLYYYRDTNCFLFASEIKALLRSPRVPRAINRAAMYEYFVFRAVCGEQTMFDGIQSLLPGSFMTVSEAGVRTECYWSPCTSGGSDIESQEEAAEQLESLLADSVNLRLMSEVPLGTFCSGGVDSSLVTALAARSHGSSINTFSVSFHEQEFDESVYARKVSEHCETQHHELFLDGEEFSQHLPRLIFMNDEPLNFANSVHIYAVSKLAKEHVTVVLTGEGADELFLGYPRYHLPGIAEALARFKWFSVPILRLAATVVSDHRLQKLLKSIQVPPERRVVRNAAIDQAELADRVLNHELPRQFDYRQQLAAELSMVGDVMSRLSLNDQLTYLVSILNRQDKMSMAASVEARVPFLDYRIVEFANGLRTKFKTHTWTTKQIVKKVARRYLPEDVVNRRKSGFGVPLAAYFKDRNGLGGLAEVAIRESDFDGLLDKEVLISILDELCSSGADHSDILWTAVNFLLWKEAYQL